MANEITHNAITGLTLYACRWQLDGDVFLTSGASDEVWGTGGRDADDYDVAMTEEASSGHYKADFDASANIASGTYKVAIYKQAGGSPVDSDPAIAQGEIYWDGTTEINLYTLDTDISSIATDQLKVLNIYDDRGQIEATPGGVYPIVESTSGGVYP